MRKRVKKPTALRPERYTSKRKAEFLLSNAIDGADYRLARKEVQKFGLEPDSIPHKPPCLSRA